MNMIKNKTTKTIAIAIAVLLLLMSLAGCSKKSLGTPCMTLENETLTVNMFRFYLSRAKGAVAGSVTAAYNDAFWDQIVSEEGLTYNDLYVKLVLDNAKNIISAMYLFDDMGLKLDDATIAKVDDNLEELMRNASDGGTKTEFNAVLAGYGVNYEILREIMLIEKKMEVLKDELYGVNASKVSDLLKEKYYEENYVRFKQVFLYTVKKVEETDKDGNVIYYDTTTKEYIYKIDETTKTKTGEDGNVITDKFGNIVYYNEDGTIAYDSEKGKPEYKTDSDGNTLTREMTDEELTKCKEYADRILAIAERGDDFDKLVDLYNEDEGLKEFTNGYYLTESDSYSIDDVKEAVFGMKDGEIKMIKSEYGYHIIKRYELDQGAFNNSVNQAYFENFNDAVVDYLFFIKMDDYKERIVVDENALKGVDMKSVEPNYYY
ncbi:MAG: peptidylprolyl isomerase [Clostridia bacterium]|nr:peptidylprolyl isomerase [Clostridia bacterium]MDY3785387.1 peptidylprolyl isomerase [Eubacteriales bacterium]